MLACSGSAYGQQYNYAELLQKSLYFYETQRSGKLPEKRGHGPADNRVPWRGDGHLKDGESSGVDLTGGWYDAGDDVKWNLSMAHAILNLALSGLLYKEGYEKSHQLEFLKSNIRWVNDYFIKCIHYTDESDVSTYKIFTEVGVQGPDHNVGFVAHEVHEFERIKKYGPRNARYADRFAPNADVVSVMAAAMAYSSQFFKENGEGDYAAILAAKAERLYAFASAYPVPAVTREAGGAITPGTGYPDPNNINLADNLAIGALGLYRVNKDQDPKKGNKYLKEAKAHAVSFVEWFDSPRGDHHYTQGVYNYLVYLELLRFLPAGPERDFFKFPVQKRLVYQASPNATPHLIDPGPDGKSTSVSYAPVNGGVVFTSPTTPSDYRNAPDGSVLTLPSTDKYNPGYISRGGGMFKTSDGYFPAGLHHSLANIAFMFADWLKAHPDQNPVASNLLSGAEIEISNATAATTPTDPSVRLSPISIPAPGLTLADKLSSWAQRILDFSLGSNPDNRSYVLGFQPEGKDVVRIAHGPVNGPWSVNTSGDARHIAYGALLSYSSKPFDPTDKNYFRHMEQVTSANHALSLSAARMMAQNSSAASGLAPIPQEQFPPQLNIVERNNVTDLAFQDIRQEYATTRNHAYGRLSPALNDNNSFLSVGNPTDLEFFAEAAVKSNTATTFQVEIMVNNRSRWPARMTNNMSVRYYFTLDAQEVNINDLQISLVELGNLGSPVAVGLSTNPQNPLRPIPVKKNSTSNEYYVEVGFPNTPMIPSTGNAPSLIMGFGYAKRAVLQFSWAGGTNTSQGPNRSSAWNHTNDHSFGGSDEDYQLSPDGSTSPLTSSRTDNWERLRTGIIAKRIPVYESGAFLWGDAPWNQEEPADAFLSFAQEGVEVPFEGGSLNTSISSNVSWSIYSDAPWITINQATGERNGTVDIQYQTNTGTIPRTGYITVSNGSFTDQLKIVQPVSPANVPVLSPNLEVCPNPPCTTGNAEGNPCDDTEKPVLVAVRPAHLAKDVNVDANIELIFSEPVFSLPKGGGNYNTVRIRRVRDNGVHSTYDILRNRYVTGLGTNTIVINPQNRLDFGTDYYIEITPSTFADAAGNIFEGHNGMTEAQWPAVNKMTFSTKALTASPCNFNGNEFRFTGTCPEMTVEPQNGATNVHPGTNLIFNVGREVTLAGGAFYLYKAVNNSLVQTFTPGDVASGKLTLTTVAGRTSITLNPDRDLDPFAEYYVLTDESRNTIEDFPLPTLRDAAGLNFRGIISSVGIAAWRFTTGESMWQDEVNASLSLKITQIILVDANDQNPIPFKSGDVVPATHFRGKLKFVLSRPVRRYTPWDRRSTNPGSGCFGGDNVQLRLLSSPQTGASGTRNVCWNCSQVMPYASWTCPSDDYTATLCDGEAPSNTVGNNYGCPRPENALTNMPLKEIVVQFWKASAFNMNLAEADEAYTLVIPANAFVDVNTGGGFANVYGPDNKPMNFNPGDFVIRTVEGTSSPSAPVAPVVTSFNPANNATNVSINTNLTLNFNVGVRRSGKSGFIRILDKSDHSTWAKIDISNTAIAVNNNSVTIPNALFGQLPGGTAHQGYYVLVDEGILETFSGEAFVGIVTATAWSFTTGADTGLPQILASNAVEAARVPAHNQTEVGLQPSLIVHFSKSVRKGTGDIVVRRSSDNGAVAAIPVNNLKVTLEDSRVGPQTRMVIPGELLPELEAGTRYYVSLAAGLVEDRSGNVFAGATANTAWVFTTTLFPAVIVSYTTPPLAAYSFTFDQNVAFIGAATSAITIHRKKDNSIFEQFRPFSSRVVLNENTITLLPTNDYEPGQTYYVKIGQSIIYSAANPAIHPRFVGIAGACAFISTIPKAPQEITFQPLKLTSIRQSPIELVASSTSGLPVSFRVLEGKAHVQGNLLYIDDAGKIKVEAYQPGDDTYLAAAPVEQSFVAHKGIDTHSWTATQQIVNETALVASVSMYPNPATATVTLQTNTEGYTFIDIISMVGNKVLHVEGNQGVFEIDVAGLPKGLYVVRVNQGKEVITEKLLIQ
jgi:hypothetical protein